MPSDMHKIRAVNTNDDFFRVLGKISVVFATWDVFVSSTLTGLCLSHVVPFAANDTLGRKLRRLAGLGAQDVTDQTLLTDLQSHLQRSIEVAEERNRYIHDQWVFDGHKVAAGRIRRVKMQYRPTLKGDWRELTLSELEQFAETVVEAQKPFAAAAQRLHPAIFNVSYP